MNLHITMWLELIENLKKLKIRRRADKKPNLWLLWLNRNQTGFTTEGKQKLFTHPFGYYRTLCSWPNRLDFFQIFWHKKIIFPVLNQRWLFVGYPIPRKNLHVWKIPVSQNPGDKNPQKIPNPADFSIWPEMKDAKKIPFQSHLWFWTAWCEKLFFYI